MIVTPPASRWSRLAAWGAAPLTPGFGRERLALLAAFTLLVVMRLPAAWVHGRFLGEEGTIFFAYAWHRPWSEALLRSFGGYLNLGANLSTLAAARAVRAGLLPLEAAPYLTMTIALAAQTLPAILILTSDAAWLAPRRAMLASLLAIAIMPMTEEVFVNVLHIQFHLALCAALILALDVPGSRLARVGQAVILVAAPLCGPGAIVLLPFFVLRAIVTRDRDRAIQASVFALGAAVQLAAFFTRSPVRGDVLGPATLAAIAFVRLVALPVGGIWLAKAIGAGIHHSYVAGGVGWRLSATAMTAYAVALIGAALSRPRDAALWLIVPGLGLAAVSFGGGMIATDASEWFNVGAGQRYNFLPLVMVTLGLIALAERGPPRIAIIARWLVGATLIWGIAAYPFPIRAVSTGPNWAQEVAAWQIDHRHALRGWPASWTVDLSADDRPCPPGTRASSRDPSYCESAWLAHVNADVAKVRAEARR